MSAGPRARRSLLVVGVSALWMIPVWLTTVPPMVDYPQHVAMAAIVRWLNDPGHHFQENYTLALHHPNILFELLVAGLAFFVPIDAAAKLIVSLSLAAVGPAAVALARRAGRPDWYALVALSATYNFAFFWGFVGNLIAYPLMLAGVALVDRQLDSAERSLRWLVSVGVLSLLFYVVHLQFLFLFLGAAGWLLLARAPSPRRLLGLCLAGLPAISAAVLQVYVFRPPEWTPYQSSMRELAADNPALGVKLSLLPECVFGARRIDRMEFALAALFGVLVLMLVAFRPLPTPAWGGREWLRRTRFVSLSAWFALLYVAMPNNLVGTMVFERLAPLALMFAVAALPRPTFSRARMVKLAIAGLAGVSLAVNVRDLAAFEVEAAGLEPLIASTAPGRAMMGLVFDRVSNVVGTGPTYLHFPAMYQARRGGRLAFSFTELDVSVAQIRPEKRWDDLLKRVIEWTPERFDFERDGENVDYFLVRGNPAVLPVLFRTERQRLIAHSRGEWHLVERSATP